MKAARFDLVIICGPPASGKMTVGQALMESTGLKLFHNHMSLELVNQFFDFGTPNFRSLDAKLRFNIFEEIADSPLPGFIFTIVLAFNEKEDEAYLDKIIEVFANRDLRVCLVELVCDLEERLLRNKHPNRLQHKASKRDVAASEKRLLRHDNLYRMNSVAGDMPEKSIFKIENTTRSPQEVAKQIIEHYDLK